MLLLAQRKPRDPEHYSFQVPAGPLNRRRVIVTHSVARPVGIWQNSGSADHPPHVPSCLTRAGSWPAGSREGFLERHCAFLSRMNGTFSNAKPGTALWLVRTGNWYPSLNLRLVKCRSDTILGDAALLDTPSGGVARGIRSGWNTNDQLVGQEQRRICAVIDVDRFCHSSTSAHEVVVLAQRRLMFSTYSAFAQL